MNWGLQGVRLSGERRQRARAPRAEFALREVSFQGLVGVALRSFPFGRALAPGFPFVRRGWRLWGRGSLVRVRGRGLREVCFGV